MSVTFRLVISAIFLLICTLATAGQDKQDEAPKYKLLESNPPMGAFLPLVIAYSSIPYDSSSYNYPTPRSGN